MTQIKVSKGGFCEYELMFLNLQARLDSIMNNMKIMLYNEKWEHVKFLLKSEEFLTLLGNICRFPVYQRRLSTCYLIENFLEFLQ